MKVRSKLVWVSRGVIAALTGYLAAVTAVSRLEADTIFVDGSLTNTCLGTYSLAQRNALGHDGTAYPTIIQAANVAKAGDTVLIREGVYHNGKSKTVNDVLWPKNSGTPGHPITFKPFNGESVILGKGAYSYPNDTSLSIARAVVTLTNVSYITIEGLQFRESAGWVYGRHCQHIVFTNNTFADGLWSPKNVARLIDSKYCSFVNCTFTNGYDTLSLNACDYTTVLNCNFTTAEHSLLALRSCNYTVVRNCNFKNPYYVGGRPEKLVEVYDHSLDNRDPLNPSYIAVPLYNDTKRNLFESNFFGYFPANLGNVAAQPSAMEYSGQNGIIRKNVFSNPPLTSPDPDYPAAKAGGYGIFMAYGGSWTGWDPVSQQWIGQGDEAGYVSHNRFFNNVFYGYDNGCINTPNLSAVDPILNPPPMTQSNPPEQYPLPYEFTDNIFMNNIISPGTFQYHVTWTWQQQITGMPVGATMLGDQPDGGVLFLNNDFYAQALQTPALVSLITSNSAGKNLYLVGDAELMGTNSPNSFDLNLEVYPTFANPGQNDFRLQAGSTLTGGGAFLTVTAGSATNATIMHVLDAGFFFDGFGIEGEVGDLIQLEGQTNRSRVVHIDYDAMIITLDQPLSWQVGQGVSLPYSGSAPDIGLGLPPCSTPPALAPLAAAQPVIATATNATLIGAVTANLSDTTYYFQYGLSTNYDSATSTLPLGSGNSPVAVSNFLENLSPGTTYHFQVVAENDQGLTFSSDQAFTTPDLLTNLNYSKPVLAHTNLEGSAYTFTASASSTVALTYQWLLNGLAIPGATNTSYALSNITLANAGVYSLKAQSPYAVGCSSAALTVAMDVTAPGATIAFPTAGLNVFDNVCTATGTATDNARVVGVSYSLNGQAYQSATTTNGWKNWSAVLDGHLQVGTNLLVVQSLDFSGNTSPLATRSFVFAVPSLLTVLTSGQGTLSTNLDQQPLLVGQKYSLTALPGPGWVFSNWWTGPMSSPDPGLMFTMQSNLVLTANFIPSPFGAQLAGNYSGLFSETNGASFSSAGLLTLTVNTNGTLSGRIYLAGASIAISTGLFDASGHESLVISRSSQHLPNLLIDLQMDMTGNGQCITGTVSSADGAWNAPFWGARAVFGPANPTSLAGKYTFAIPGFSDSTQGPAGNGYASITVSTNGTVSLSGNLGDGTKQTQVSSTLSISPQGLWPLYQPLYSGGGALMGWVNLVNQPGALTNVSGSILWVKSANPTNATYAAGFTNVTDIVGSGFVAPASGKRILGQTVSALVLAGADLPAPLTNNVTLSTANALTFSPNPYCVKATITTSTGLFAGSFINPITGQTNLFNGTLIQDENLGAGEFLSTTTAGAVLIQ